MVGSCSHSCWLMRAWRRRGLSSSARYRTGPRLTRRPVGLGFEAVRAVLRIEKPAVAEQLGTALRDANEATAMALTQLVAERPVYQAAWTLMELLGEEEAPRLRLPLGLSKQFQPLAVPKQNRLWCTMIPAKAESPCMLHGSKD